LPFADRVEHVANPNAPDGTLAPEAMERAATTTAGEIEALLAATEKAAEALKEQTREEIDAALADLTTLVAELRDAADRLEERLTGIRASVGAAPAPPQPEQDSERRARLVALNMAANGASRAETASYLSQLGVRDREALLDSVYESLGGG
jgi:uncharacterized coiled-coil protein SlyX